MKLTVKVEKRDKVRAFVRDFEDYGCINRPFDTEDFVELENAVILTVEEASNVWDSLVNLVSYVESIDGGMSDLVRDGQRNIDLIRKRIKKAEGK